MTSSAKPQGNRFLEREKEEKTERQREKEGSKLFMVTKDIQQHLDSLKTEGLRFRRRSLRGTTDRMQEPVQGLSYRFANLSSKPMFSVATYLFQYGYKRLLILFARY